VYERIERYCEGPYLELFARQIRPGWDAWGDEIGIYVDRHQVAAPWVNRSHQQSAEKNE
jgi:N6-adenosine-specific RNA methylase IME4